MARTVIPERELIEFMKAIPKLTQMTVYVTDDKEEKYTIKRF